MTHALIGDLTGCIDPAPKRTEYASTACCMPYERRKRLVAAADSSKMSFSKNRPVERQLMQLDVSASLHSRVLHAQAVNA